MTRLVDRARAWVATPVFADEDKTRRAALLNTLLLIGVGVGVVNAAGFLLFNPNPGPLVLGLGVLVAVLIGLLALLRAGVVTGAGHIMVGSLWVTLAVFVLVSGGVRDPASMSFTLAVLVAGLVIGTRAALAYAIASGLFVIGAAMAEANGVLPLPGHAATVDEAVITVGANVAMVVVIVLLLRRESRSYRDRFETLFQASPVPMVLARYDTSAYVAVNEAWLALIGVTIEQTIGSTAEALGVFAHPEDRRRLEAMIADAGGQLTAADFRLRDHQGRYHDVLLSTRYVTIQGRKHYLSIVQDISERRQMEFELESNRQMLIEQAANLRAVNRIAQRIHRGQDLATIADSAVRAVVIDLGVASAGVYLREGEVLLRIGSAGLGADGERTAPAIPVGEGLAGLAVAQRETVYSEDLATDPRALRPFVDNMVATGIRAAMFIPLLFEEDVVGCLTIAFAPESPRPVDQVTTFQAIANTLALAMANARVVDQMRDVNRMLEDRVRERTVALEGSRQELETFYQVSQQINGLQSFAAILGVVAPFFPDLASTLSLSIFPTFDARTAETFEVVAVRPLGSVEVVATQYVFGREGIAPLLSCEVVVIEDISRSALSDGSKAHYAANGVAAQASVGLCLGERMFGLFQVTWGRAYAPSAREVRLIQAAADVMAAAVERVYLYNEQVRATEKLREVDRMKTNFLATVSHELRTPLNAVINFTQFVSSGMLGPVNEKQADALQKATGSSRRLLDLINDVLDMSKIEAGRLNLYVETGVDLHEELAVVAETARGLLHDKPVALVEAVAADLPRIACDRRRLTQILLNLLSNACKFTEMGEVVLGARAEGDGVQFWVADTGVGIAAEDFWGMFEPFRQARRGAATAGTGLGLAITRSLVEAHGGRIWFESAVGVGSTFFVWLPVGGPVEMGNDK